MRRTFFDQNLLEWEAYVSGGQPGTRAAARIYFNCLTDVTRRPLFVAHEGGDLVEAQRALAELDAAGLVALLDRAESLP
jgi:hypothetical protein